MGWVGADLGGVTVHRRPQRPKTMRDMLLAGRLGFIAVAVFIAVDLAVDRAVGELPALVDLAIKAALLQPLMATLGWYLVVAPLCRIADGEMERQRFDQRLHRALELADDEADCHEVVEAALREVAPGAAVELLLADSSDAHLRQVLPGLGREEASCGVTSPHGCPAIRRGQLQVFRDQDALDTCPHLRRSGCATSATCTPVNVAGKTIGVVYVPDAPAVAHVALESAAGQAGARIGMLRVMARAHLQAATDPLTGLLNRRSIEERAESLVHAGTDFAVAFGDLDHFKKLNDIHGHATGDRALRLFARTCAGALRSTDSLGRFGGEEFVVLLPGLAAHQACEVLRRVQDDLLAGAARAGLPNFTVSFGVAHSSTSEDFPAMLREADEALLEAKRAGRNLVVPARGTVPAAMAVGFGEVLTTVE
jgi:diguanylate cyclase (GGDEF)-like protein